MGQTILSSVSPLTGLNAEVITENDCSYFYLYHPDAIQGDTDSESSLSTFAACWIKNHVRVDDLHSPHDDIKLGMQPKIPTKFCAYQEDLAPLNVEKLQIIWGKEGSLAALYEDNDLICVIPYWTNLDFNGYSKYSRMSDVPLIPSPLVKHLSETLFEKVESAKAFWSQDFDVFWKTYRGAYLAELKSKYGDILKYYALDKGKFPPKGLVVFKKDDIKYAFTLGIGMFPQPKIDLWVEDYRDYQSFEVAFSYRTDMNLNEQKVFAQIASIVSMPWSSNTFLDHRLEIELQINEQYKNAVIVSDKSLKLVQSEFLKENNINLFWLIPITDESFKNATNDSSGGEATTKASKADVVFWKKKSNI